MDKRGQFYIIAAILIVIILFGVLGVATYAIVKPSPRTISDISSDLNREGQKIVDYGIYNNEADFQGFVEDFLDEDVANYILKKTQNTDVVFVYGNLNELKALKYKKTDSGRITIGGANWQPEGTYSDITNIQRTEIKGDPPKIEVEVLKNRYIFELKENQIFYFVIANDREDETFIETSETSRDEKIS